MSDRYKFFGEIALEKRFVSAEQLYEALTIQAKNRASGLLENTNRILGHYRLARHRV